MSEQTLPTAPSRITIVSVQPQVDGGCWPIKRTAGEHVDVVAGLIIDGHDKIAAELWYRHEEGEEQALRMKLRYNDEYVARFEVPALGRYTYRVRAWVDRFATWQDRFRRRVEGGDTGYEIDSELAEGAALLRALAEGAGEPARGQLLGYADRLDDGDRKAALSAALLELATANDPKAGKVESDTLAVWVDPEVARFAAWYEFFPRSAGETAGRHATLDDAADRLPAIKERGFDVVYLPPIHPIGVTHRKGPDNAPEAGDDDPGSPWAIGSEEGGHKAVHSDLGGLEAFDRFVERARSLDLHVALDVAFQTSPDHPYVAEHPEWFRHRPDGTIRYAENPPKKYQDVYPFDFECDAWRPLWEELRSVFTFWIDRGVKIFRVDNPHTKPLAFWAWCIDTIRGEHPDVIFLAEAFARPKVMYTLARLGFNNSYTYFTWRNTKDELQEYCRELFCTGVAEFFRPNFWPNTPDILHDYLVHGGRPAHVVRLVLAATLSSAYGIYGPPYEHVFNQQHPDREEYAHNEKYEVRAWDWDDPQSLQPLMKRINRIRRENPALHFMRNLRFVHVDNPEIVAYTKQHEDNLIVCVVNLDPWHAQEGWLELPLEELDLADHRPYQVHDLLGGDRFFWNERRNLVRLDPAVMPAHIFRIQRYVRTERDFDYFL